MHVCAKLHAVLISALELVVKIEPPGGLEEYFSDSEVRFLMSHLTAKFSSSYLFDLLSSLYILDTNSCFVFIIFNYVYMCVCM